MVTKKELYAQGTSGFWEDDSSGHIYYVQCGFSVDDWTAREKKLVDDEGVDLTTGEEVRLTLENYLKFKRLDEGLENELSAHF